MPTSTVAVCATEPAAFPLYLDNLERLREEHIIDVLKLGMRPARRALPACVKGTSNEAEALREALASDPYNMRLILDLGNRYAKEGHIERCANVLVRGWKRANELEDPSVRFRFLMKLCEVSYLLGRFRQAQAVLQDITEPEGVAEMKAYSILACHVHGANKDVQQTLRAFQRAIEGMDYQMAVRIFALTVVDLRDVGMYEVARSAVEKLASENEQDSSICMLDAFGSKEEMREDTNKETQKYFVIAIVVAIASFIIYLLYVLEQWSLAKLKK